MKKLYVLCVTFLLLFSILPALAADEYPQYLLDAQDAIEQAQQEITAAQDAGMDTLEAEGYLMKVSGMYDDAVASYESEDFETAEELAGLVVELARDTSTLFVEPDNEVDDEIIDSLSNHPWRMLRLLQLQKTLDYTVRASTYVKEYIQENNGETEDLDNIIGEIQELFEHAQNLNVDDENFQEGFVNILKDARKAIKEFRGLTRPELKIIAEYKDLKKELKNIKRDVRDEYKEKLAEAREDIKRVRVLKFFEKVGYEDEDLIEQLQNKEITAKEALAAFRQDYKKFSHQEKKDFRNAVKENVKNSFNKKAGGQK